MKRSSRDLSPLRAAMTLVHEVTHALQDQRKPRPTVQIEREYEAHYNEAVFLLQLGSMRRKGAPATRLKWITKDLSIDEYAIMKHVRSLYYEETPEGKDLIEYRIAKRDRTYPFKKVYAGESYDFDPGEYERVKW